MRGTRLGSRPAYASLKVDARLCEAKVDARLCEAKVEARLCESKVDDAKAAALGIL